MEFNHKIVPFSRDTAYLRQRALKNVRESNLLDAVELLRRAIEINPEDSETKLDLARTYSEMGCTSQSNRILLDLYQEDPSLSECLFGLAVNRYNQNDTEGAKRALQLYQSREAGQEELADAREFAVELGLYDESNYIENRRIRRAESVSMRACRLLQADEPQAAQRLFARAIALAPESPDLRSLHALALFLIDRREDALRQADIAISMEQQTTRSLSVAAQVCHMAGETDRARRIMRRAIDGHPSGIEMKLLIYTLGEMGMDAEAEDCCRLALHDAPYDRQLLHARAVAILRTTGDFAAAGRAWERILRMDPEDEIARYFRDAAASGSIDPLPSYAYQVSEKEARRRVALLTGNLTPDPEELHAVWNGNPEFRALLKWAVTLEHPQIRHMAVTTLAMLDAPDAKSFLREVLMREDVPLDVRLHAVYLSRMRGSDASDILPPDIDPADGLLPDAEALLDDLPTDQRQLVRYAAEVLEDDYGATALSALSVIWVSYRQQRGLNCDPLSRTESAAAALCYIYLKIHGEDVTVQQLCSRFRTSPRQVKYFISRIETVLQLGGLTNNG